MNTYLLTIELTITPLEHNYVNNNSVDITFSHHKTASLLWLFTSELSEIRICWNLHSAICQENAIMLVGLPNLQVLDKSIYYTIPSLDTDGPYQLHFSASSSYLLIQTVQMYHLHL